MASALTHYSREFFRVGKRFIALGVVGVAIGAVGTLLATGFEQAPEPSLRFVQRNLSDGRKVTILQRSTGGVWADVPLRSSAKVEAALDGEDAPEDDDDEVPPLADSDGDDDTEDMYSIEVPHMSAATITSAFRGGAAGFMGGIVGATLRKITKATTEAGLSPYVMHAASIGVLAVAGSRINGGKGIAPLVFVVVGVTAADLIVPLATAGSTIATALTRPAAATPADLADGEMAAGTPTPDGGVGASDVPATGGPLIYSSAPMGPFQPNAEQQAAIDESGILGMLGGGGTRADGVPMF